MAVRGTTEVLTFKANMDDLHKKLAELPGITDKEAKKMVRSMERQLKRTEKAAARAAKKSGRSMKSLEKSMQAAGEQTSKLGSAASAISPAFGGMVSRAGAVAGGLSAMMNPVGLAIGGMVALAAAVGGTTVGMVMAVRKARDLHEELKKFDHIDGILPPIDPQQLAALESANAAMDSLSVLAKSALLTLGAEFAPAVEKAAMVTLKFGLMGLDAFQAFAAGHDVLRELAVFLGRAFIDALVFPISGLMNLIEMMGDLATAVGHEGLGASLSAFGDKWDQFTDTISRAGVDVVFDAAGSALDRLGDNTSDYDARARALMGTMSALHAESKAGAASTEKASEALAAIAAAAEKAAAKAQAATDRITALQDATTELIPTPALSRMEQLQQLLIALATEANTSTVANLALAESIEQVSAAIKAEQSALDAAAIEQVQKQRLETVQKIGTAVGYAQQGMGMLAAGFDETADNSAAMVNHLTAQMAAGEAFFTDQQKAELNKRIKQQKKAAQKAFETAKAAKVGEAIASTALGVINAFSQHPPPSPLGFIGAGIVAATGARSVAQIQAQRVTFHTAAPPDEIPATVLRSERIVTSTGRQALGDETIRQANAGVRSSGGPVVRVLQQWRHRVYNDFVKEGLTMGNPISEAISADRTIGHRSGRKGA